MRKGRRFSPLRGCNADGQTGKDRPLTTTTTPESRGRLAYTAYGRAVNFKAFDGTDLKPWDELPAPILQAWIHAANAIWDLATTGRAEL